MSYLRRLYLFCYIIYLHLHLYDNLEIIQLHVYRKAIADLASEYKGALLSPDDGCKYDEVI